MHLIGKSQPKLYLRFINFDILLTKLTESTTSHYSSDLNRERFYKWIKKNALSFQLNDNDNSYYARNIRETVFKACNEPSNIHFSAYTTCLELYLEQSNTPIEEIFYHKNTFKSRVRKLNRIGIAKLLEYYEKDKKILIE